MAFIDSTVVNVAIPALQDSFQANIVEVQWVVESYALLLSALILVGGSLGDHFGRRRIFLAGVILFAAASALCGLSRTIQQLIVYRAIQGAGAALMVPGSLAIISASFDEQSRGRAIGTWSGFTAITTALGPVFGGWLIQHASWRWAFFVNLPLAAAVIAISLLRVPESRSHSVPSVDIRGTLLVILGLGGLVAGFVESSTLGWSRTVIAALVVGCLCLVLFVWVEAHEKSPMVPLELFHSSEFSGANLLTLFLYSALSIFFFLYPMNLIQVHSYSTAEAAAAAFPMIVLMSTLSRWAGGLVSKYGGRLPLIVGPLIAAAGFFIFGLVQTSGSYWRTFLPGFIVLGFGMTVTVAPLTTVVMNCVGQDRAGTASGINNAVSRVAGVLAVAILGLVMTRVFEAHLDHSLAKLALPADIVREIDTNSTRLAAINIPTGLNESTQQSLRGVISDAFVFAFRVVMGICVILAITSAGFAARMIPGRRPKQWAG
jgi:EmrB/QacA subfamily drug resistance transporter